MGSGGQDAVGTIRPATDRTLAVETGTPSRSDPDEAIVRRLAAGEQAALAELYDLHAGRVFGIALRIVRDRSDAEDVVQEVFVQAWRQAARFDHGRGSVVAWVCTMARTRSLDRLRRRASRREAQADDAPVAVTLPRPEESLAVRKAMQSLSDDQRQALELAYFGGLTQTEIAVQLDEPLGTVKSRIRMALSRLRQTLERVP